LGWRIGSCSYFLCIDRLLVALSRADVVGSNFVGALAYFYADDIVLLAPSVSELCIMLAICDTMLKSIRFHLMLANQNA